MPYDRHVFLNHVFSRSKTRAPREYAAPMHSARELLGLIDQLYQRDRAIVYPGVDERQDEDQAEIEARRAHSSAVRIRHMRLAEAGAAYDYAWLLVEHIDDAARSFPVVHRQSFRGRELAGEDEERGAATAHIVVRLPKSGEFDDGKYRAAIEVVSGVTRVNIGVLINRLLRQLAESWTFTVETADKKGKRVPREYKYRPRLELNADIGRAISGGPQNSILTHLTFTKRSERLQSGQEIDVALEDLVADVELKISAKQAPEDVEERRAWVNRLKEFYHSRGFQSKIYFRHTGGAVIGAGVLQDEATAADMLLCPKEVVNFPGDARNWRSELDPQIMSQLRAIVDNDALWPAAQ